MIINRDSFNNIEDKPYILCKASGERVGIIQCATTKTCDINFVNPDEITCDTNLYINEERNPIYDQIDIWKYIEVPDIGLFVITQVDVTAEGTKYESKMITARSAESQELGQKYIEELYINQGEDWSVDNVQFYNAADQQHSLLHLIISEKCDNWTFNHIDPELAAMHRSFEFQKTAIYDAMMTDIAEAFECYFVFDTLHRQISAYLVKYWSSDTNIHVSFNNLLEKTDMSSSLDDIKTCLTITGADDVNVRDINLSSDRVYMLDYFHDPQYMSQSLYDAYGIWSGLADSEVDTSYFKYMTDVVEVSDLQGKTYTEAFTWLLDKYKQYYSSIHNWESLYMPAKINQRNIGYGDFYDPTDPFNDDKTVHFDSYNSVRLLKTIAQRPTTGELNKLYIVNNTNDMYRWTGTGWFNVNIWTDCALNVLNEKLKSAEQRNAVDMKKGYGDADAAEKVKALVNANGYVDTTSLDSRTQKAEKNYVYYYLDDYYTIQAINAQLPTVQATLDDLYTKQSCVETDKKIVSYYLEMRHIYPTVEKLAEYLGLNYDDPSDKALADTLYAIPDSFTVDELKELSTFIREEELTDGNFVVTDTMTDEERFDMLNDLLKFGTEELAKMSQPQIAFSSELANLYAIPEFDQYSGQFDVGNYIWVTLRDDYSIKAKLLTIHLNFLDHSDFSVTFGNVMRTARTIFTDVQDAINTATSAATSVSMNASHWSASAKEADDISKSLEMGLLAAGEYLKSGDDSEMVIDSRGIFVNTVDGDYADDSIFIGGGRILFTNDDWRTVSMSVGRGEILYPTINASGDIVIPTDPSSMFGTFADFVVAGYVGGSMIVGGNLYSSNFKKDKTGTHLNLTDGAFQFNYNNQKALELVVDGNTPGLYTYGTIYAKEGRIGCDPSTWEGGFTIQKDKLYNGKSTWDANSNGVYIGTDYIALGAQGTDNYSKFYVSNSGKLHATDATITGKITATSGQIAGFTIGKTTQSPIINYLYSGSKSSLDANADGVYLGDDGIALGKTDLFKVTKAGVLTASSATITGTINAKKGIIGVQDDGTGGFTIDANKLYNGKSTWDANANGVYIGTNYIALGKKNNANQIPFYVSHLGELHATNAYITGQITASSGSIGDFTIDSGHLYHNKTSDSDNKNGVYISKDCIALGSVNSNTHHSNFYVSNTGELYASNVHINGNGDFSGSLSAATGTFKGKIEYYHPTDPNINWPLAEMNVKTRNVFNQDVYGAIVFHGDTSEQRNWVMTQLDNLGLRTATVAITDGRPWVYGKFIGADASHHTVKLNVDDNTAANLIITGNLDVRDGISVTGSGTINGETITSDERLKKDIQCLSLDSSRDFIMGLQPKEFRYIDDDTYLHHGFIAQDVVDNNPWIIRNIKADIMGIGYQSIIADLVNVVQDQERRLQALEGVKG